MPSLAETEKAAAIRTLLPPPAFDAPTEVESGIWWLRLRLPFALDHVNVWLLQDGGSWTLIDTGYSDTATRAVWERILAPLPVAQILVTHFHPDHFGLAGWLAERARVPVLMSRTEWLTGRLLSLDTTEEALDAADAHYRRAAMPEEVIAAQRARGHAYRRGVPTTPAVFHSLEAGQELTLAGTPWRVIIGQGHAPEQVTLYAPERRLLIAADQILPRISPVIGVWSNAPDRDPLGEFLTSLRQYHDLPEDTRVLPSHDAPFAGLHARLASLASHHDEHLAQALDTCREPATAAQVLRALFPKRYDPHQMGFALAETLAHLNHLCRQGTIARWTDEEEHWRYVRQ